MGTIGEQNKEFTGGHVRPLPKFAANQDMRLKPRNSSVDVSSKHQGSQTLDGLCG